MQYSNETNQLLISLYQGSSVSELQFKRDVRNSLIQEHLISRSPTHTDSSVFLTEAGKAYVESLLASKSEKKTEKFRFWVPVIISILALLVALVSLSIDFVELLGTA